MKFYIINGEGVMASRLATALHKYGQGMEAEKKCSTFGDEHTITVRRVNLTQFRKITGEDICGCSGNIGVHHRQEGCI